MIKIIEINLYKCMNFLSELITDLCVVNFIIILAFALRFNFNINLSEIYYSKAAIFTYSTIISTIIFLRLFNINTSDQILYLIKLVKLFSLNSIVITLLCNFIPTFEYRNIIILSWALNMWVFAIVKIPWIIIQPTDYDDKENNKDYGEFFKKIYSGVIAGKKELKSLLINVIGSIIAFLIIYYILGFR